MCTYHYSYQNSLLKGFYLSFFLLKMLQLTLLYMLLGFPGGSVVKNPPANAGDVHLIHGLGRFPGEGNGNHSSILACKIPRTGEPGGPWFSSYTTTTFSSVQSLSRVRLCDPMNRSTPGLPVHHHPPEFTQTHVHRVRDAIQPSHPLSSPSPPAPNPSQHQSLFQWVNSSHEVAKVLAFQP